jgi:hypothetical protein
MLESYTIIEIESYTTIELVNCLISKDKTRVFYIKFNYINRLGSKF